MGVIILWKQLFLVCWPCFFMVQWSAYKAWLVCFAMIKAAGLWLYCLLHFCAVDIVCAGALSADVCWRCGQPQPLESLPAVAVGGYVVHFGLFHQGLLSAYNHRWKLLEALCTGSQAGFGGFGHHHRGYCFLVVRPGWLFEFPEGLVGKIRHYSFLIFDGSGFDFDCA